MQNAFLFYFVCLLYTCIDHRGLMLLCLYTLINGVSLAASFALSATSGVTNNIEAPASCSWWESSPAIAKSY